MQGIKEIIATLSSGEFEKSWDCVMSRGIRVPPLLRIPLPPQEFLEWKAATRGVEDMEEMNRIRRGLVRDRGDGFVESVKRYQRRLIKNREHNYSIAGLCIMLHKMEAAGEGVHPLEKVAVEKGGQPIWLMVFDFEPETTMNGELMERKVYVPITVQQVLKDF